MRILRAVLAAASTLIFALSWPVQAESLVRIADNAIATSWIDVESIRVIDGMHHFSILSKDHHPASFDGTPYSSMRTTMAVLCREGKSANTGVILYDGTGAVVKRISFPRHSWQFRDDPPGRNGSVPVNFVCANSGSRPPSATSPAPSPSSTQRRAFPERANAPTTRTGSGFAVDRQGGIVTNQHVVKGCSKFEVRQSGNTYAAQLVVQDSQFDLALLRVAAPFHGGALRGGPVEVGEAIFVAGFPLAGVLSVDMNFTGGVVASAAGLGGNFTQFQITAPVQQGNSGGPILDSSGNIAGVVVSKLDAVRIATATGDIPQNVNFAIKADVLRMFLDANRISYSSNSSALKLDPVQVANKARGLTVQIACS